MRLYLLRHGIAETGRAGSPDRDRALTADGQRKLRDVLRAAKSAGTAPDLIVSSPYRRAWETAQIAAKCLGYAGEIVPSEALTPEANPADAWTEIRSYRDQQQLLLVSHEPLMGQLTGYLLGAPALLVDFKKGALARIDLEEFGPHPRGVLRWFLPPKLAAD